MYVHAFARTALPPHPPAFLLRGLAGGLEPRRCRGRNAHAQRRAGSRVPEAPAPVLEARRDGERVPSHSGEVHEACRVQGAACCARQPQSDLRARRPVSCAALWRGHPGSARPASRPPQYGAQTFRRRPRILARAGGRAGGRGRAAGSGPDRVLPPSRIARARLAGRVAAWLGGRAHREVHPGDVPEQRARRRRGRERSADLRGGRGACWLRRARARTRECGARARPPRSRSAAGTVRVYLEHEAGAKVGLRRLAARPVRGRRPQLQPNRLLPAPV